MLGLGVCYCVDHVDCKWQAKREARVNGEVTMQFNDCKTATSQSFYLAQLGN